MICCRKDQVRNRIIELYIENASLHILINEITGEINLKKSPVLWSNLIGLTSMQFRKNFI